MEVGCAACLTLKYSPGWKAVCTPSWKVHGNEAGKQIFSSLKPSERSKKQKGKKREVYVNLEQA
eukprot:87411-Pelagomonas_calceolata.AAC.6